MREESKGWAVLRVAGGNVLEMYDFMVFGYYAIAIARTFFPAQSEFSSLMLSLMTFGVGFVVRPIGAIVLGLYFDRHGRRSGLLLTLGLMSAGILIVSLLPGYETLGLIAPILIVMARLLQGFSAGVEPGGVSVYLSEIATEGHRGFYVSWQSAAQQVAVMLAALVGIIANSYISAEDMGRWGWRVPMLIGCMIVPAVFLLRRSLEETKAFASRPPPASTRQMLSGLASNAGTIILIVLMGTMMTVPFYTITAYTPTFGVRVLHLATLDVFIVTLCVGASNFVWLPIMGAVSDRLGRPRQCRIFALLTLLTAYPAMTWLVSAPDFTRLILVELWFSFLYASYNAAFVPLGTELVPAATRTTGFALAFSLATAIFGGFTPAICTWLVHATGNPAIPGAWLSVAGLLAFCAATVVTRSADRAIPQSQIQLEAGS